MLFYKLAIVFASFAWIGAQFLVPDVEILAFSPKGIRVSIPDGSGIRLFAFHANFNKKLDGAHVGDLSREVLHMKNGRWGFEDCETTLKVGDTVHYWYFVIKDGLGYRRDDKVFVVKELVGAVVQNEEAPTMVQSASAPQEKLHFDDGRQLMICERSVANTTKYLITIQSEVMALREENKLLISLLEEHPNAGKLVLSGGIPPGSETEAIVGFVLREKLGLRPIIVSAKREEDESITFEVSLNDKLRIINASKDKLAGSRIAIKPFLT